MRENGEPWGFELIIDAGGCNDLVKDAAYISDFAIAMVEVLGMEPFGLPQVVHFGNDYLEGNTLVQLIYTSNITAHFNDVDQSAYLNIFSCKRFDQNDAIKCFGDWFQPQTLKTKFISRDADAIN